MANRDLFRGIDGYDNQRRREKNGWENKSPLHILGQRMLAQAVVALLLFCGVVYLYEQESALGEGVRYIVALASADEQEIMAVNSFADIWQDLRHKAENLGESNPGAENGQRNEQKNVNTNDVENGNANNKLDDEENPGAAASGDMAAAEYQPDGAYLEAAPGNAEGNLVMILPASGLMQSAFGDIDEQGLKVEGLKIFCQNQQEIKAAAIGEVIQVVSGEKIVLRHRDGVESCYQGAIEPAVQVGETLRQGQLLGRINESTLFFQVLRDSQPMDPFLFVKGPE